MSKATLLIFLFGALLIASAVLGQSEIAHYRGRNRLLLVFAPSKSDPRWQKQNELLEKSAGAFRERDLVRLDYLETSKEESEAVRSHYGVKPGQFRVLLIGKDGHVASGGPTPVSLDTLTEQIDQMPMRRVEMRQRGH